LMQMAFENLTQKTFENSKAWTCAGPSADTKGFD
jgi:hypothetical protein